MEDETIARQLILLSVLHRAGLRKKAPPGELYDGQLPLLAALNEQPGMTQQELAECLYVTPASVALSAKRLERSGLIRRTSDRTDRRRKLLYVTEAGAELAGRHRSYLAELDHAMLSGFSDTEREHLSAELARMIGNITNAIGTELSVPGVTQGGTANNV